MSKEKGFILCKNPESPNWQLNSPVQSDLWMLGWQILPEYEIEGGMPDEIAEILAKALTSTALVTFPTIDSVGATGDCVQRIEAGVIGSVAAAFSGTPGSFNLISTTNPETAKNLFNAGYFPWDLQGQIILLSPPGSQPPVLDRKTLFSVMDANLHTDFKLLSSVGVQAMIYPGVDGDLVGIVAASPAFENEILRAIEAEAVRSGFGWQVVTEDEFWQ